MEKKKSLVLLGSICLVLVLAALPFMAACAKPAPAPAPAPAPTEPIVLKAVAFHTPGVTTWGFDQYLERVNEAAKGELDPDARAELIRQAVQVMHDDPAGIWIAAINDVMCFTDSLKGQVHSPWYMYVYWPYNLYRE